MADLWSTLTDPSRLAHWYGQVSGDLREGGQLRIRIDGPDIEAPDTSSSAKPPSLLRVQIRQTDQSGRGGEGQPFD